MNAPAVPNSLYEPFFDGLRKHQLSFPHCHSCDRFHWYPMNRCPYCRSSEICWKVIGGIGTVFTSTVVRHAFDPAQSRPVPYTVALVEFAEAKGVRLVTNLCSADMNRVVGLIVEPVFLTDESPPRVVFRPKSAS